MSPHHHVRTAPPELYASCLHIAIPAARLQTSIPPRRYAYSALLDLETSIPPLPYTYGFPLKTSIPPYHYAYSAPPEPPSSGGKHLQARNVPPELHTSMPRRLHSCSVSPE